MRWREAEEAIQFVFGLGDHLADQTQGKLAPDDRELLQQGFLVWGEAVNAGGQDALHGGGNMQRRSACCVQPIAATLAAEHAFFNQRLHHLFHEERRAFGLLQNELFEGL